MYPMREVALNYLEGPSCCDILNLIIDPFNGKGPLKSCGQPPFHSNGTGAPAAPSVLPVGGTIG